MIIMIIILIIIKAIADKFGFPPSTLSTWIKNSEKIQAHYKESGGDRKRARLCEYPGVKEALMLWFKAARIKNIKMNCQNDIQ
jgi:hypothetical protein